MKLFKTNKTALRFSNNASQFLNGLTSNTIDSPQNAFLNIHGRIIATFDQLKLSDDVVVICVEAPFVKAALDHIDRFAKLSGVKIEQLEHIVYYQLDSESEEFSDDDFVIKQKKGRLICSKNKMDVNVPCEEFTLFRLKNNYPAHGVDYTDEFILNVSEDDFVSFTKGCFLGQEPISKVHHRSKPSWKLVVKRQDECSSEEKEKMTSKALDPATGHLLGFVFMKNA